jgi:polyphosphate kinase 2 (PPK2 family)
MLEIIDLTQKLDKDEYERQLDLYQTQVRLLGYHLYHQQRPCVIVFEGWDAAGKGGAINRLTERLDPRGFVVHPIAAPRGDDAEKALPVALLATAARPRQHCDLRPQLVRTGDGGTR